MINLLNDHYYTLQKKIIVGYQMRCFWFLLLMFGTITRVQSMHEKNCSILFHSTTSFTNPGRVSDSFCERDVIIKLLRGVQKGIAQNEKPITVIPLVKPGNRDPVDAAQLINHIKPDISFIFSAYKTENSIPECSIYWYTWSSSMVFSIRSSDLIFVAEADAYRISYDATVAYAQALQNEFCALRKHWGQLSFAAFPLIPLRGLIVPAFLIEIGLPDESMADSYGILIGQIIATIM
jgi:hypothetical protein